MSNPAADLQSFIVFWSRLYAYNNAEQYQIIHKKELAQDDLIELYTWKNGMKLSAKKKESLSTNILGAVDEINRLRSSLTVDLDNFLIRFSKVSTVWKIFLLHICKPKVYPIYDQHIHRAYMYIHNKDYSGISSTMSEKKKLDFYFMQYLPFVEALKVKDMKKMDEAFFAFGQFLNTKNQHLLVK